MKTLITTSFEETQKLGFEFGQKLKGGEVVLLRGDLGSGKTTFVQGLAKGLGVEQRIISPTFIIMRSYAISNQQSAISNFYHIDLYRIESERDIEGLGILELMGDSENIVVIEWPEKIEHLLPDNKIDLSFEYIEEDKRKVSFL